MPTNHTDPETDSITIRITAETEETVTLDPDLWHQLQATAAEHEQPVEERLNAILKQVLETDRD